MALMSHQRNRIPADPFFFLIPTTLFFFSGLSGLVYEVVWSRMLVLVMGNTTMATSTILAAFMGGLAVGSFYWGRFIETDRVSGLTVFGWMEIGVGVFALAFPALIKIASPAEIWLAAVSGPGNLPQLMLRFLICCTILAPPTFLMGGTFSVLGHYLIRTHESFSRKTSLLYGVNTAGAVLGAFFTGFFLIHLMGHRNSLWLAAALSITVGAIALWTDRNPAINTPTVRKKEKAVKHSQRKAAAKINPLVMTGLMISGFCAMAYQVLWTRLLILIADNSVYSFTSILVIFLAGIAAGSLVLTSIVSHIRRPGLFFGALLVGISATAFCYPFFIEPQRIDLDTPYWYFLIVKLPLVLIVPTMLMGMAFPLAAHIHQISGRTVGGSIGNVLATNTIGAVAGAVAAGFWLIPVLGFRNGLILLSMANLAMGAAIIVKSIKPPAAILTTAALAGLGLAGFALMPADYFEKKYARIEPGSRLIYYSEDKAANVTVFQRPDGNRVLYINGIPEVDTSYLSVRTLKLLGALAGVISEQPDNALMVTFGAGITAGSTALFANRVDCVDLAQQARTIAGYFGRANGDVANNPKVTIHVDDARHYLQTVDRRYAIIVSDATHPRSYDSWVLFTRQFYELVKSRLADDGGIFCQWLPFHGMDERQFTSIVRTFASVFPHTSIWREGQAYIVLLATPAPLTIDFTAMADQLKRPTIRQALRPVDLDSPIDLLKSFSMGPEQIARMTETGIIIEDNSPEHLFFSFRATLEEQYQQWPLDNYRLIKRHEESVLPYVTHISSDENRRKAIISRIRRVEQRDKQP
jgi:spermidine synthase